MMIFASGKSKVGVGVIVGVGVMVGVGVIVGVGVMVGVDVFVGVGVGVRVGVCVGVELGAGVRLGVDVSVAVGDELELQLAAIKDRKTTREGKNRRLLANNFIIVICLTLRTISTHKLFPDT